MCVKKEYRDSIMLNRFQNCITNDEKAQMMKNKEVFALIESGLSNAEIMALSNLSYTEVVYYRINYEKGARNEN